MAIQGFTSDSQTLPFLPGSSTEDQKTQVLNDVISRLNLVNSQLQNLLANNSFKILLEGTASLTVAPISTTVGANASDSVTIAHGLGYAPAVLVYLYNSANNWYEPISSGVIDFNAHIRTTGTTQYIIQTQAEIHVDDTNLFMGITTTVDCDAAGGATSGGTYVLKYYILRETAS